MEPWGASLGTPPDPAGLCGTVFQAPLCGSHTWHSPVPRRDEEWDPHRAHSLPKSPSAELCSPQALVLEQAAQGSGPPDLRMQYLRQIQTNHEVSREPPIPQPLPVGPSLWTSPSLSTFLLQMLLKEAQSLRDHSPLTEEDTEKLLHIYQQLRNPSLVLL